jgi:hypothetical protein
MSIFKNISYEIRRMRYLIVIHTVTAGCLLISGMIVYKAITRPRYVLLCDDTGAFHYATTKDTYLDQEVAIDCAKKAVKHLLERTYNRIENTDLLNKLFIKTGKSTASDILAQEKKDFREKKIKQTSEIVISEINRYRKGYPVVSIKGFLFRHLEFKGQKFVKKYRFATALLMKRNIEITENGDFPFQVAGFKYKIKLEK